MEKNLDICIAAFRRKGLDSIASLGHPEMPGVRYIVAWQYGPDDPGDIPPQLSSRKDFLIIPNDTRGSGANRSVALRAAEAPLVLISDDDVSYTEQQLRDLIKAFKQRPDLDFILFRYHSEINPRPYPDYEFDMRDEPAGYFFGGPEIAFRLRNVREAGVDFNPLFGIGAEFANGEDSLFVYDMMHSGLTGHFVPVTICGHESDSTGMRAALTPPYLRAKGAIFTYIHPHSWFPRMIRHALRLAPGIKGKINYCRHWLSGVRDLRRIRRRQTLDGSHGE